MLVFCLDKHFFIISFSVNLIGSLVSLTSIVNFPSNRQLILLLYVIVAKLLELLSKSITCPFILVCATKLLVMKKHKKAKSIS